VARRKVKTLIERGQGAGDLSGAGRELKPLAEQGRFEWIARGYQPGDVAGAFLVAAASDDPAVNQM